jgi:hypothetical protein
MNKTVEESTLKELNNFPGLLDAIIKYLDQYWDIEAKPKGYDKYLKTYQEHDTEDHEYEFDGPLDESASCDAFPERISISNIAYSDTQQGRTPLRELIGAVFAYGLNVGAQRERIDKDKMWAIQNARDVLRYIAENKISAEELNNDAKRAIKSLDFRYPLLKEDK